MRLKELRRQKAVTQKEIAEYVGCSVMAYSRYENEQRQPSIELLCMLAEYFETTTDAVIGYRARSRAR